MSSILYSPKALSSSSKEKTNSFSQPDFKTITSWQDGASLDFSALSPPKEKDCSCLYPTEKCFLSSAKEKQSYTKNSASFSATTNSRSRQVKIDYLPGGDTKMPSMTNLDVKLSRFWVQERATKGQLSTMRSIGWCLGDWISQIFLYSTTFIDIFIVTIIRSNIFKLELSI